MLDESGAMVLAFGRNLRCLCQVHHMQWPTISWASDQGSDGLCALNFLRNSRVAVMRVADQSHRISNDADLALSDCRLSQVVALVSFIIGTDAGPWGQGRWYQSMVEATTNYLAMASPEECPLFNDLLPKIAGDMNERDLLPDDAWKAEAFANIRGVYNRKERRVPGTRWFSFVDSAGEFLPKWHTKLLLLFYHLLQAGLFDNDSRIAALQSAAAKPSEPTAEGAPDQPISTAADSSFERTMRRTCANQLQLQAMVLADGDIYTTIKASTIALSEVRLFHGLQNKHNRSCMAIRQWFAEQAVGGGLAHLLATIKKLNEGGTLEYIGFTVAPQPAQLAADGIEAQALLDSENALADRFATLVTSIIGRRLTTMAWHERNLPGKLAGLLLDDKRAEVLEWIRAADSAMMAAEARTCSWWKRAMSRSSWQQLVVQKVGYLGSGAHPPNSPRSRAPATLGPRVSRLACLIRAILGFVEGVLRPPSSHPTQAPCAPRYQKVNAHSPSPMSSV